MGSDKDNTIVLKGAWLFPELMAVLSCVALRMISCDYLLANSFFKFLLSEWFSRAFRFSLSF